MADHAKSNNCCGKPAAIETKPSSAENTCCSPASEATESRADSSCCGPQSKPASSDKPQTEKRRLDIDFLYLDLNVCDRCQDTGTVLEQAIDEIAPVLEITGVEVVLKKTHVVSEEQAVAPGISGLPDHPCERPGHSDEFRESLCESCGTLCACEGGVSCREWEYQGQWFTAPPKGLIIEAILTQVYGGAGATGEAPRQAKQAPDNLKRFFAGAREGE